MTMLPGLLQGLDALADTSEDSHEMTGELADQISEWTIHRGLSSQETLDLFRNLETHARVRWYAQARAITGRTTP